MSRPQFSRESIAHALAHHDGRGALLTVSPPEPGERSRWRVAFPNFNQRQPVEFTEPQAWALCVGLAASEDHARVEHERFVRELSQRDGPICLDDDLEHEVALLRRSARLAAEDPAWLSGIARAPELVAAVNRALDETKRTTSCGIHGDDTTSGRCMTCDVLRLHGLLAELDAASTLVEAESPFAAVGRLCERQPRLIPAVLSWARSAASGATL